MTLPVVGFLVMMSEIFTEHGFEGFFTEDFVIAILIYSGLFFIFFIPHFIHRYTKTKQSK